MDSTITPHHMRLPDLPRRQATGLNTVNHHRARQSHCVTTKLKPLNQKPETPQTIKPPKGKNSKKKCQAQEIKTKKRFCPGSRISTAQPSTTPDGLALGPD